MPYFDFGTRCTTILGQPRACNQKAYGQAAPPAYDLSRIATPLALFTGARRARRAGASGGGVPWPRALQQERCGRSPAHLHSPSPFACHPVRPASPHRTPRPGGQDRLADPADAALLLTQLDPDWVALRRAQPDYAHLDYLWGINAPRRVYADVVALLKQGPTLRAAVLRRKAAAAAAAQRGGQARPRPAGAAAGGGRWWARLRAAWGLLRRP
jgi:hypothetical protein